MWRGKERCAETVKKSRRNGKDSGRAKEWAKSVGERERQREGGGWREKKRDRGE